MARDKAVWEEIEKKYRTGQYSNTVLATQYKISEAAIRKKAKKEGWKKDLINNYQTEVQNILIEKDSQGNQSGASLELNKCEISTLQSAKKPKTDKERAEDRDIVKEAAAVGARVVLDHRKDITKLRELANAIGNIVHKVLIKKHESEEEKAEAWGELNKISSNTESVTDITHKLARIQTKCIQLERQAHNLDAKDKDKDNPLNAGIEDRIKKRMEKLKNGII